MKRKQNNDNHADYFDGGNKKISLILIIFQIKLFYKNKN